MREVWRAIPGYERLYEVSSMGRIRRIECVIPIKKKVGTHLRKQPGRILAPCLNRHGYPQVVLSKNNLMRLFRVHRLVLMAFVPNPENKPDVNHKNGRRDDNRLSNLEWATSSENHTHKYAVLKRNHPRAIPIRCLDTGVVYPSSIAAGKAIGCAPSGITQACRGQLKTIKGFVFQYAKE